MKTLNSILSENIVEALGWTIIHSLWQGAIFAIALGLLLVFTNRYSSLTRYLMSIFILLLFVTATLITFMLKVDLQNVASSKSTPFTQVNINLNEPKTQPDEPANYPIEQEFIQANDEFSILITTKIYFERHIPLIVTLWLLGILIFTLRFLGSLAYIQRMRSYQTNVFPTYWIEQANLFVNQIGLTKKVKFVSSNIALTPMAMGVFKPAVIIPAKLFTGLTEEQMKAILIHELAHIKRNDFLVNILQSIVEILFFYHPGVWWISTVIRNERENCCDDITVSLTGEKIEYAKTLIQLQTESQQSLNPALGLTGLSYKFSHRIKRLFNQPTVFADYREGFFTAIILVLGVATLSFISLKTGQNELSIDAKTSLLLEQETPGNGQYFNSKQQNNTIEEIGESSDESSSYPVNVDKFPLDKQLKFLFLAIEHKDIELVKYILEKDVDVNGRNQEGRTPLVVAAHHKALEISKLLIQKGSKVNLADEEGYTALMEAADHGAFNLVKLLIHFGADPNRISENGHTALMEAADHGYNDIINYLLDHGADPSIKIDGWDALRHAKTKDHKEVTSLLEKVKKDSETTVENNNTEKQHKNFKYKEESISYQDKNYSRPIGRLPGGVLNSIKAPMGKSLKIHLELPKDMMKVNIYFNSLQGQRIKTFLDKKLRKGKHNFKWGLGNLKRTTYWLHIEIDGKLLKQRVGQNCAISWTDTEQSVLGNIDNTSSCKDLLIAVKNNDIQKVKELLNTTNPNCEYREGGEPRSPLVTAAREGNTEIGKLLLNAKADVEYRTKGDESPLMAAAAYGHINFVKLLLGAGANINRKLGGDGTALIKASQHGHEQVVKYLITKGADVDAEVGGDGTALINAVRGNYYNIAKLLLENGADPNKHSPGDENPKYHAYKNGDKKMIQLLEKY